MLTVLIVDDEDVILGCLQRLLCGYFRVRTARCVSEALAELERTPVDVLLTDLNLGTENGLALLSQARVRFPQTRRMLMSGREPADVDPCERAALLEQFFPKPFHALDLIAAICGVDALGGVCAPGPSRPDEARSS